MPENATTQKPKLMDRISRGKKIALGIVGALTTLASAVALFLDELGKLFGGQ